MRNENGKSFFCDDKQKKTKWNFCCKWWENGTATKSFEYFEEFVKEERE